MANIDIIVLEDFTTKRVVIKIVNGGIDAAQEEISFTSGETIICSSVSPSSLDGYYNITLDDSSNIMEVPASKISYINTKKTRGCSGCGHPRT